MADASILVEIEAVLPRVTQLDDADLARYKAAAGSIAAYNSGYTDAQRAQAAKMIQVLYAEQERRKGAAPASGGGSSTSKPPASKPPAKGAGSTGGQTQAPPPEPEAPAAPAGASSSSAGTILVVGGLTALTAVAGGLVYRAQKQRQGGM